MANRIGTKRALDLIESSEKEHTTATVEKSRFRHSGDLSPKERDELFNLMVEIDDKQIALADMVDKLVERMGGEYFKLAIYEGWESMGDAITVRKRIDALIAIKLQTLYGDEAGSLFAPLNED